MGGFAWRVSYRLATGSKSVAAWCWAQGPGVTLAAAGTVAALPVYEPASTLLAPAFAWGIAAWARGEDAPHEAPVADAELTVDELGEDDGDDALDEHEPEDAGEQPTPASRNPEQSMRDYVEHSVAANRHLKGRQGVHVSELLEGLQYHGQLSGWETKHLTAHLKSLRIPVRDVNIKANGKQLNRPGVRYDDLTAHLGRAPALPPQLVPDLTPR